MGTEKSYQKAVQDLQYWQEGQDFFTCQLYSLMQKADVSNFAKLASAFPVEAKAFSDWYYSDEPMEFFEQILGAT